MDKKVLIAMLNLEWWIKNRGGTFDWAEDETEIYGTLYKHGEGFGALELLLEPGFTPATRGMV